MAKVLLPFLSQRALGSVGSLTASEAKQGATMRLRVNPTQPRTAAQLAVRSILAAVSALWATCSQAQRDAWAAWAADHPVSNRFGSPATLSGHQAFCALNSQLANAGQLAVLDAPTDSAPAAPTSFAAADAKNAIDVSWDAMAGTDKTVQVWLQGPVSPGRAPDIRSARVALYQPGQTSPGTLSSLEAGYYHVWARTIDEDDGQVSPFVTDSVTVTDTV